MNEKSRRILGTIIGMAMGLAYSLVAQNINGLILPGIPLYEAPPGKFNTILITILIGGLMGLIAAWPDDALPGILLSAVVGTTATSLLNIYLTEEGSLQITGALIVFVMTFLPRAVLFLPLAALTRWVIGEWSRELKDANFSITRMALSLLLVVVLAGAAGVLSLYARQERQVLEKTYRLIQEGKQASSLEGLPEELKPVDGFIQNSGGAYTLHLSTDPDQLPITRPEVAYNETEYAVIVTYENGFRFGCVFTPPGLVAICRAY
jgi:hypothetical protein